MFGILKTIIWIVGAIIVAGFILNYFGYEINTSYFTKSKARCQEEIAKCGQDVIKEGTNNAKCDFACVNPKLIIRKK
jgi:hypothetical protein